MLYTAFLMGLLGSFHCIGMCGPIAFMLPLDHTKPVKKVSQLTTYHIGRLLTYSIIGALFGLLGRGLFLRQYQQQLSIIIGILLILAVIISFLPIKPIGISRPVYLFISKVKIWIR